MKCRTWQLRLLIFGFISESETEGCGITNKKAGAAQWKAGTSRKEWGNFMQGPPFGDDPIDQFWIKQGIDYAKQHHF